MSEKIWIGAIYLSDEGGYEIVLKSLRHYKNRLKTIGNSPELKDAAAMFASVLHQQARKTVPKIDEVIQKIQDNLTNSQLTNSLSEEVPFLEKALQCYEADIHKAQDTGHEYFVKLVGDMVEAKNDLEVIKTALEKIKQYSEKNISKQQEQKTDKRIQKIQFFFHPQVPLIYEVLKLSPDDSKNIKKKSQNSRPAIRPSLWMMRIPLYPQSTCPRLSISPRSTGKAPKACPIQTRLANRLRKRCSASLGKPSQQPVCQA